MIIRIAIVLLLGWAPGFLVVLWCHLAFLQMVTPGLALSRAAVWPIFLLTGRPHGVPLTRD